MNENQTEILENLADPTYLAGFDAGIKYGKELLNIAKEALRHGIRDCCGNHIELENKLYAAILEFEVLKRGKQNATTNS